MKKLFLIAVLALAACNKNNVQPNTMVFAVKLDANRPYYLDLIIGSDSQKVDSLYKHKFDNMIHYTSYYHGDTLRVEKIISKHYLSNQQLSNINNYINQNQRKKNSCDSFGITTNCMLTTYNNDGELIKNCMLRSDFSSFIGGLLKELNYYPTDSNMKFIIQDLNALCNANTFSYTIQQLYKTRNGLRNKR